MVKIELKNESRLNTQVQVGTYLIDLLNENIDEIEFIDNLDDIDFLKLQYLLLYYDYEEAKDLIDECYYYESDEELVEQEGCYALNDLCGTDISSFDFESLFESGIIRYENIINHISAVHNLFETSDGGYLLIYN